MSESARESEKMFVNLPGENNLVLKAADAKITQLIEDIKQINAKNAALLLSCAERIEENSREFERKFAELGKRLLEESADRLRGH